MSLSRVLGPRFSGHVIESGSWSQVFRAFHESGSWSQVFRAFHESGSWSQVVSAV